MLTKRTLIKEWVLKNIRSQKFFVVRKWIFNNSYKFDIAIRLAILVFIFCVMISIPSFLNLLKRGDFIMLIPFLGAFISVGWSASIKNSFMFKHANIFDGALRYIFLFDGDRVKVLAKDERKNYQGIFVNLYGDKLEDYLKTLKEKN
jgi:hypothetical protein